ncbi:uncharacterized protein LOC126326233 [Schistocerca gregaria]|uniref:uncharacterized protein LOC126326233 n=1 Tax=Schistocerca gregaria TaxID=7010 RepID=UPI00211E4FD4|nr:uncharacterized protein LOC126326233 [Schistocerca gregaria]
MAMRRFGYRKGFPKPRTDTDWNRIWKQHKIKLPNIKSLKLFLSDKGPGHTGMRHFKSYMLPPIQHWNPFIKVEIERETTKYIPPVLLVEHKNGESNSFDANKIHSKDILEFVKNFDKSQLTVPTQEKPTTETQKKNQQSENFK